MQIKKRVWEVLTVQKIYMIFYIFQNTKIFAIIKETYYVATMLTSK